MQPIHLINDTCNHHGNDENSVTSSLKQWLIDHYKAIQAAKQEILREDPLTAKCILATP